MDISNPVAIKGHREVQLKDAINYEGLDAVLASIQTGELTVKIDGKVVDKAVATFVAKQLAEETAGSSTHNKPSGT